MDTNETVRVGAGEDGDFFAFGAGREGGLVAGRLFAGRFVGFCLEGEEEERERRRVFTDEPPTEDAHSFIHLSKKIHLVGMLRCSTSHAGEAA